MEVRRSFNLQGHQIQRLAAPVGVRTDSGLLWITVDGQPEDILLAPGQSRRFERDAPVIVYALGGDARFSVESDEVAAPRRTPPARAGTGHGARWGSRLAAWLRAEPAAPGRGA